MLQYFGTDGIRGLAGFDLTPELALRAAFGFTRAVATGQPAYHPRRQPQIVIGGDSRLSTPMLTDALSAGIQLAGCTAVDLGTVPTPVVPWYLLRSKAAGGVMVTASHNPVGDNGLKFFGADGVKISTRLAEQVERAITQAGQLRVQGQRHFGRRAAYQVGAEYLEFIRRSAKGLRPADGMRIVLDCAHGATCELAPQAFSAASFEVVPIHCSFDGARVNVGCGATNLSGLKRKVRQARAALGLAFDGDGDRVLAVDEYGQAVDGDRIIAILATSLRRYRRQGAVVMTHMSNLGVEEALQAQGVRMLRTDVGDSLVLDELMRNGLFLGGEQSGHIIMRDKLTAGDGILAGMQLALTLCQLQQPLSILAARFPVYPQLMTNVTVGDRFAWARDRGFNTRFSALRREYGDVHFYLRPSGTENYVRVTTQSRTDARCRQANALLCEYLKEWDAKRHG
jgi:phosphoglucosamine mutase